MCALLCEFIDPAQLHTFAIGMEGGTDLRHARTVAEYFGTTHHEVIVTEDEMLAAVPRVVKQIDASMGHDDRPCLNAHVSLLLEWITANTDVRVVFSGEGSDELSGSYLYFRNAPPNRGLPGGVRPALRRPAPVRRASRRQIKHCRARSGSPREFSGPEFRHFYLRADPVLRRPLNIVGREAPPPKGLDEGRLPSEVVWRVKNNKEAFSDGVSGERSWYQVADEHAKNLGKKDEASWYRSLFDEAYVGRREWFPYQWLPKWCIDVTSTICPSVDHLQCHGVKVFVNFFSQGTVKTIMELNLRDRIHRVEALKGYRRPNLRRSFNSIVLAGSGRKDDLRRLRRKKQLELNAEKQRLAELEKERLELELAALESQMGLVRDFNPRWIHS